jgi:hypothetical protein
MKCLLPGKMKDVKLVIELGAEPDRFSHVLRWKMSF